MNLKIDKFGYVKIFCHECQADKDLGDIFPKGKEIICLHCGTLLGYAWDLPDEVREKFQI